ncbi:B2L14 protein, partial [Nothoprocta ornata]|nr:B2L14 protein [Nothoprocta pentlandii]NWY02832.1 B2L14 protein [Nothoprocta ornata]
GTVMSSSNDANMEEISLEDDERDSIEYRILMAYAQRRLSANKYGKFLKKEANVQKSLSLIRREVETEYQDNKDGPSQIKILHAESLKQPSQKKRIQTSLSKYSSSFGREKHGKSPKPLVSQMMLSPQNSTESFYLPQIQLQGLSEKTNVDHIADRLAKLVTSRSQPSPSDVSLKWVYKQGPQRQGRNATDGSKDEENDEDNIIHTIVALLAQSGDQLEEKIKKDKSFYQYLINRLSYTFFERLIDLTLTAVSADSTSETEGQAQCTKAAFALEVATRLTAVDSHPMNMVLGFGVKYLREHFTPWIRHQGGW